jgi:curved DNA-binding protein CbpA
MSTLEQKIDVDYYKILGVPKNATIQQICAKYH